VPGAVIARCRLPSTAGPLRIKEEELLLVVVRKQSDDQHFRPNIRKTATARGVQLQVDLMVDYLLLLFVLSALWTGVGEYGERKAEAVVQLLLSAASSGSL